MSTDHGIFPTTEAERNTYYINAVAYILIPANTTRLLVSAGNVTAVTANLATWNSKYAIAHNPATKTIVTIADKHTADHNLMNTLRTIYKDIPESVLIDADLKTLHITIHKTDGTPSPVPTTFPLAVVDTNVRLQHSIAFKDEKDVSGHAKPAGVHGCEIWEKIGDPAPVDASELTYVGTATKTPFINHFVGNNANANVHYWLRWINSTGEHGPWGPPEAGSVRG